jgi:P pilus assembly chaperone PapD
MPFGTNASDQDSRSPMFSTRFLVLVVLLLALTAGIAKSQLAVGRVELVMQVADTASHQASIAVRNESTAAVQALVRLEDWDRDQDGANRWFGYGSQAGNGSCAPALSIFPQSLRLEPGAEQSLRVVLDRAHAPTRECWAAAVVETVQPIERGGQRIAYVVRTAVKIYVEPSNLTTEGEIGALRVVPDSTDATTHAVELCFSNTGSKHVVAQGMLEVRQADNTVVSRTPLPTVYALPGAKRLLRVTVPELKQGDYVFLATMDYGGQDIAAALAEHRKK